ncbi:vanillyl-alcohol oxidase [Verticillium alfalfae VaMs.102]|uniref:Vanillyl-alcohol oxidase n=1 Tax=Verticillium alfalfae (strain VaMs.102 / ATCC MYA-4576 / FGSC 10136) TaxID=526221 RepID=C9SL19_VERA1|nr:vanillyl-alcohol oxidase [Verticillium alfalfae VaMs.102]EEY19387.1 vanillyl-alcohol oxidase [Verticillium alfalfae VaMs.102]
MHAVYDKEFFVSCAVVHPRTVTEVQEIMRLCNKMQMPVWPYSVGRNTGYGGAAPRVPGTLGMELGRHMNRIHEVNVDGAYALVEPGVTFFSLYDHLVKTGLDEQLWLDVPDLGGGSIIGRHQSDFCAYLSRYSTDRRRKYSGKGRWVYFHMVVSSS